MWVVSTPFAKHLSEIIIYIMLLKYSKILYNDILYYYISIITFYIFIIYYTYNNIIASLRHHLEQRCSIHTLLMI